MFNGKNRVLLLAALLFLMGVFSLWDKEISVLEYAFLCINAVLYLLLVYLSESLNDSYEGLVAALEDLVHALKLKNEVLEELADYLEQKLIRIMDTKGISDVLEKVDAMPKVMAATGEVYVDYEEVMTVLRGDEIVER